MTSRARVYGSVPQFSAKQAELAELVHIVLPGAYRAFGTHVGDAGLYCDEFVEIYQQIAQLRAEISLLNTSGPSQSNVAGPAAQAKSLAQTTQQMFLVQSLKLKILDAFGELGRAAFERYGEQSGPSELIRPILHGRAQVERLEAEISQLSGARYRPFYGRKRFVAAGLAIVVVVIFLIPWGPSSDTMDGTQENSPGQQTGQTRRSGTTTNSRGDESDEQTRVSQRTTPSTVTPREIGDPAGQGNDSDEESWYRSWWVRVLSRLRGGIPTAAEDKQRSARRNRPARPQQPVRPTRVTATFYGDATLRSGSLTVLNTDGAKWLIDCGADRFESEDPARQLATEPSSSALPCDARTVVGVFVTQAHVDHIGRLPLLIQQGFGGPIYLTEATRELAPVVLDMVCRHDRARKRDWVWSRSSSAPTPDAPRQCLLHWRTACAERRKIPAGSLQTGQATLAELTTRLGRIGVSTCAACATDEVAAIMAQCRPVLSAASRTVAPGIAVTFLDAGQIPGSASLLFEIAEGNQRRWILFSGEVGNNRSPLLPGPRPAPDVDTLVITAAFAAVPDTLAISAEDAAFRQEVSDVVKRGGTAWIICDVLDQTQRILHELRLAQQAGQLAPEVPIFCPSPTAAEISRIYRKHQRDGWFRDAIASDDASLSPEGLDETEALPTSLPRPCVLITGSEMIERADWAALSESLLTQDSTRVFCLDAPDAASRNGFPQPERDSIQIDGKVIPIRAVVRSLAGFRTYAESDDLDQWLAQVHHRAKLILVGGDASQSTVRAAQLRDAGWSRVVAAEEGCAIRLDP
ncbi:MAG: hypothetical protein NTY19_38270 [Planctomycetota bacterium]|nr:hypothetical protein [Planctomycetota bacterium]